MKNEAGSAMHDRIKKMRIALKLTQAQFAKAVAISKSYIGAIELAERPVNDRLVKLVCSTFGANEEWLRSGKGNMFGAQEEQNEKYKKLLVLFQQLCPRFQDHLIKHLNLLLELQDASEEKQ
ncbi:MAG: helix-turn-helix transcriptional regulator [Spirochaetales bacterium]|jgi:transcriptional regulator with XRE-family HTH domain|nr:helix-turn-helix transcriptional regulator [Spirochaetales bacterium]